jgi:hypothetical protein
LTGESQERSLSLKDFTSVPRIGDTVIGTFLWPIRVFGTIDYHNPISATAVIASVEVEDTMILITRMGGLFARPPEKLATADSHQMPREERSRTLRRKIDFETQLARRFNQIICELALNDSTSEPASPVHIAAGRLIDGHAMIAGGGGVGKFVDLARMAGPLTALFRPDFISWPRTGEEVLSVIQDLPLTSVLTSISSTLPELVASVYALFRERQLAEAMNDAWIVVEQILDYWWKGYLDKLDVPARRQRLDDTRSYTAAVRTEYLLSVGALPAHLYEPINDARKARNNLAHRAEVTLAGARACINAFRLAVQAVCQREVASPFLGQSVSW